MYGTALHTVIKIRAKFRLRLDTEDKTDLITHNAVHKTGTSAADDDKNDTSCR